MKKPKRITLRRKADKLWSQVIMKRNKGRCEVCGKVGTQPHHILGKKNLTLRHDPKNGCLLCFQHHTGNKTSAHQDPMWFMMWLANHRRKDYEYVLETRAELTTQVDYEERVKN